MIKRILNEEEFKQAILDLKELFLDEDKEQGHEFLLHDSNTIINSFGNNYLLAWDVLVWANKENEKYDALIIFLNDKSVKFGVGIFTEFLWLSKNPKVGFKLLKEAVKYAREHEFKYIITSCVEKHKKSDKLKSFYKKMGFVKDSETYIAKL